MKKHFTIVLTIICGLAATGLWAQSELPKNRPQTKPQTGGPQTPQNRETRPTNETPRPVYRSRPVMRPPVMYNPYPNYPVYQNNTSQPVNNGPTADEVARRNRQNAQLEMKKALWEMQAEEQAFDIKDVTRSFEIVGAKGFRIVFPELAFVDAEGNPVLGEVEIKLTEYTENSDFAAANLTTMTTDGQLLETGGMINLEAFSGEEKVQLQAGKNIEIVVPNLKDQAGFQTFYASGSDMVTWSTTPTNNSQDTNASKPFDGYTIKMLKTTQFVEGKAVNYTIFKNWQSLEEYVNSNLKVPAETRRNIMKDGIPFLYTIEFNAMGKIKEVRAKYPEYTKGSLISEINAKIKAILLDAPAISMNDGNVQSGKTYDVMFATAKNYTTPLPIPISMPMSAGKENAPSAAETNVNPTEKNVNDFAMGSSQLTKINCDRFSGSNSTDTQAFHFERADAIVYVIFKEQRSFIQPTGANGNYVLRKVPTGSAVRYVAVVYGDDGSIKMGVKDAKTENGPVTFDNLGEFKAEELKAALNSR
jgi:hypothetical protein